MAVGIVGAGRLGASLGGGLRQAGYDVRAVASGRLESARSLASALGDRARATSDPGDVLALCDLVFLTVPDAVIEPLSASLPWQRQHTVVHCSGALGLEALTAVTGAGGSPGCVHPLQSFPSRSPEPERFRGVFCGVEAGPNLGPLLESIVTDLGARSFRLEGVDRALYHAAAVMVSNHVVGLANAAARVWGLAGLPPELGREALSPLLTSAVQNVARLDFASALTGPIARGDAPTVDAHLRALAGEPSLQELYRLLSLELLRLPLHREADVAARLKDLLTKGWPSNE